MFARELGAMGQGVEEMRGEREWLLDILENISRATGCFDALLLGFGQFGNMAVHGVLQCFLSVRYA
jgi:hypothetical protein